MYMSMAVCGKVTANESPSSPAVKNAMREEQPHHRVIFTRVDDQLVANLTLKGCVCVMTKIWHGPVIQTVLQNF